MKVLDGRAVAAAINATTRAGIQDLQSTDNFHEPRLAVVLATEQSGTLWYVRSLVSSAARLGVRASTYALPSDSTAEKITSQIEELIDSRAADGLVIQTPLPDKVPLHEISSVVPIDMDVDGASPISAGLLAMGGNGFAPATATAVMETLQFYEIPLQSTSVCIIGRSPVVGRPLVQLLLRANATVTIAHSYTENITEAACNSEIVVVAAGQPNLISRSSIPKASVVIDVGTTEVDGRLVGDVDFASFETSDVSISPVPGGIGAVTTAVLLANVVKAAHCKLARIG